MITIDLESFIFGFLVGMFIAVLLDIFINHFFGDDALIIGTMIEEDEPENGDNH